jgi:predicted acylesterase/phospholipase RssA
MTAQGDIPAAATSLGRRESLPKQHCDIVMKGGITSGIVYPQGVAKLAEVYTLRNIGGTSAGAIAAVAAAAAEYGYQTGNTGAFERMARVPGELGARTQGKNSRLLLLFQPQPATRWILAALLAFLRDPKRSMVLKVIGALGAVCAAFPLRSLAAFALGILFIASPIAFGAWQGVFPALGVIVGLGAWKLIRVRWAHLGTAWKDELSKTWKSIAAAVVAILLIALGLALGPEGTGLAALGVIGGVLTFVLLFAVLVLRTAVKTADRAIGDNVCGVCTGMEGAFGDGQTPLTVWMADIFDELGGHHPEHENEKKRGPVTFADLWGTRNHKAERRVNLITMTANLNRGRPYSLPFDPDDDRFFFDEREFLKLFPKRIVEWMKANPNPKAKARAERVKARHLNLYPLPAAPDMPIVVAARMSMSFPVLLSAIPLHEYRRLLPRKPPTFEMNRCWFSDGGMCSNLPVHLFDGVLPRWPTFAINLRYFKTGDRELDPPRAHLPEDNATGAEEFPHAFVPEGPKSFVLGLVMAIKNAMQNWVDNSQVRMPGYRDRVAHIHLDETEGGMNLNMEAGLIDRIAGYGRDAADLLIAHFARESEVRTNWDNHRWVRFRSGMAMLEEKLFTAARALEPESAQQGFAPYEELIKQFSQTPKSYPWANDPTRVIALGLLDELKALIAKWKQHGLALRNSPDVLDGTTEIFLDKAPRPHGHYRVMPRF